MSSDTISESLLDLDKYSLNEMIILMILHLLLIKLALVLILLIMLLKRRYKDTIMML